MIQFFTDSILRGPTLGCMLMAMTMGIVGTLTFVMRRSLVGEALAHASYPGVVISIILGTFVYTTFEESAQAVWILCGAFASACLGLWVINYLERRWKVTSDAALCLILSAFFGVGLTLASQMQFTHTLLYQKIQVYFYGQAATMRDVHVVIFLALAILVCAVLILFYKEFQTYSFDRIFSKSIGLPVRVLDGLLLILVTLAVVIGIRCVGFVLISAMLIAPPVAARQFSHHYGRMFVLSGFFGLVSGFLGNYLSVELSQLLTDPLSGNQPSLPTGPMIVFSAAMLSIIALLFAPQRGLLSRFVRILLFRYRCLQENTLKVFWRVHEENQKAATLSQIAAIQHMPRWVIYLVLLYLRRKQYVQLQKEWTLTALGTKKAARIVRLHRLWELYLTDDIGMGIERVHRSACEMEHIITPDLEAKLSLLLKDPKEDPHHKPIPSTGEILW